MDRRRHDPHIDNLPPRGGIDSPLQSHFDQKILEKLQAERITIASATDERDIIASAAKARTRMLRHIANDIYPIPEVYDPERKESCKFDLIKYAETYHAERFYHRWSKQHIHLMECLQTGILEQTGERQAIAMPRGSGKTTIVETALMWALFYGHIEYFLIICSSALRSTERMQSVKNTILTSGILLQDFPEICYPLRLSGGMSIKVKTQHYQGTPTDVTWTQDKFTMPMVPDAPAAGNIVQATSITSSLRGLLHTTPDGRMLRPQYVILDDVQNDKTAKNTRLVDYLEKQINGAVRGLAGPGQSITMTMPCTVIRRDDLSERFLDRTKKPEWQGIRTKLLDSFPENMQLWEQYYGIRQQSFRDGNKGKEATEFYRENRDAMDKGAVATWEDRYTKNAEISAIQHAMNLYFDDPLTFASEYQNEPLPDLIESNSRFDLNAKEIMLRLSGSPKGIVPEGTTHITAGVDIQSRILYYTVTAWSEDFGGVIVDWGTYPKQSVDYFRATDPPITMHDLAENKTKPLAAAIYTGLQRLKATVFDKTYTLENSDIEIPITKVLIDSNWSMSTDCVYAFCRAEGADKYFASHGKGINSENLPMDLWLKKKGEIKGKNWIYRQRTQETNRGRHYVFDTNYWKSVVAERLQSPVGCANALLIWGVKESTNQPRYQDLRLFADHLASESMTTKPGKNREVDIWMLKPTQENHYWDCLILSAVAASAAGLALHEVVDKSNHTTAIPKPERRKITAPKLS